MENCPVCGEEMQNTTTQNDAYFHECLRCGPYKLTLSASYVLEHKLRSVKDGPAIVSYALYRMTSRKQWAELDSYVLDDILANTRLPRPAEQLDNLILWFADKLVTYNSTFERLPSQVLAAVGASNWGSLGPVLEFANDEGLVKGKVITSRTGELAAAYCGLSFKGWCRAEELKKGATASRSAFMAMKFGDAEMDGLYSQFLKPAVEATGFELRRNDEAQQAGLIDDLMRVQIRQSRFVIADLTHHNNGAYWEAGYAEGLGKPVIYTCRKDVFEDVDHRPHFDTNHHLTVTWDPADMVSAMRKLKATIRATLPEDAKQSDD